jgi:N-methylhydantoinase A
MRHYIACDVGGTFTDVAVVTSDDELAIFKAPTTSSDDPVLGVLAALRSCAETLTGGDLEGLLGETEVFVHATTLPLNAVLQGRTARTVFVTTKGHRDILSFREGGKTDTFNLRMATPAPYVPRHLTFEVEERIGPEGQVIVPFNEADARGQLAAIRATDPEAAAVCFLWSVVNPDHELLMADLIKSEFPGLPLTLSHVVNPVIREYRRASSTCIDASLKPLMSDYLQRLGTALNDAGFRGRIFSMTSAGGVRALADAIDRPIDTVNSGPSAAPVAGLRTAEETGLADGTLIVVDAGGTSFDVSVIQERTIPLTPDLWLGEEFRGHLLGLPAVAVNSVGAGGGSIAWVDAGGRLQVGPQSAGADPGPVAYARGGTEPTLTDAALVTGFLDRDHFLGGRMPLDADAAKEALETRIASPLGLSLHEAAAALIAVADQRMVNAIEEITIDHGIDPREATLVAGGGSSGLSIDAIARELGCARVLVPRAQAGLSACGAVVSDLVGDVRASFFTRTSDFDFDGLEPILRNLKERAVTSLGVDDSTGETEITWYVSARYAFQVWEIDVALDPSVLAMLMAREEDERAAGVASFVAVFHQRHQEMFAVADYDQDIECVQWRVRAAVPGFRESMGGRTLIGSSAEPSTTRNVYFRDEGWLKATVLARSALDDGGVLDGPAIVLDDLTTLVVRPGSRLQSLPSGALLLQPLLSETSAAATEFASASG